MICRLWLEGKEIQVSKTEGGFKKDWTKYSANSLEVCCKPEVPPLQKLLPPPLAHVRKVSLLSSVPKLSSAVCCQR